MKKLNLRKMFVNYFTQQIEKSNLENKRAFLENAKWFTKKEMIIILGTLEFTK